MNVRSQFTQETDAVIRIQSAYESLRKHMVEPCAYPECDMGLAVLRHRGLAAWIDTSWTYASPIVSRSGNRDDADTVIAAGMQDEVVMVLASMVLQTASVEVTDGE